MEAMPSIFMIAGFLLGVILLTSTSPEAIFNIGTASLADSISIDIPALSDAIVAEAERYLGRPYKWAGNGPDSFDCTGFSKFVFGQFGFKLRRTVSAQVKDGRAVEGGLQDLQKGDLLIFGGRSNKKALGHVGIFIERDPDQDDVTFIHAAKAGVIISHLKEKYYTERFLGVVRILPDFIPVLEEVKDSVCIGIENQVVVTKDTLTLSVGDRRIVLFENGNWVYLGEDGSIIEPTDVTSLQLFPNGRWRAIQPSSISIPHIQEDAVTGPVQSTPKKDVALYHTIRHGDTLSGIASKYHTSVSTLCRLNGINRNAVLRIGKRIRVQ